MNERDFCYWLHGFYELNGDGPLTKKQSEMVRKHLDLVFTNVTKDQKPKYAPDRPLVPPLSPLPHMPAHPWPRANDFIVTC